MKEELIIELYDIGAIKFGEFTFKSGMIAPIYIDLRGLFSYPKTARKALSLISERLNGLSYDLIAGIPYTALPIASVISLEKNIPLIFQRKEAKKYGTKKLIEGSYKKGDTCVVIDDIITNGDSKLETAKPFEEEGLVIKDFVILVDREQGGKEILEKNGYNLHSAIKITELLKVLYENKKISREEYAKDIDFISKTKVTT